MSARDVYAALSSVMPCAHMAFREGCAPELPWCVYYLDSVDGFAADNGFAAKKNSWVVEHYWRDYDEEKEAALEKAIEETFGTYSKSEAWVDSERCCQTAYHFGEIESQR